MEKILKDLICDNLPHELGVRLNKSRNNLKRSSLFTFSVSRTAVRKGMTLVEVMIALVIMTVVLGAIYSILNIQRTKAVNVQTTSILQTDAQVALSLFRWDIFMMGFGMPAGESKIYTINNSGVGDSIGMYSMAFGFEAAKANWAPVLEGTSSNHVKVYRYSDPLAQFNVNDTIVIISQERNLLVHTVTITDTSAITYVQGFDSVPGTDLTLSRSINVGQGTICIRLDSVSYFNGISYYVDNQNRLMRGDKVFLDNVEDIQFAYGVDQNNNGQIEDPGEWYNDLTSFSAAYLSSHTIVIRATFVVLSERALGTYVYPGDSIAIEDHSYNLNDIQKKRKRVIVRSITFPRNMKS